MGSHLDDPPFIHDSDTIGLHQGGDSMGNEDGGPCHMVVDGFPDFGVGFHIHRRQRVVENLNGCILHQHAGNSHTLLLAA